MNLLDDFLEDYKRDHYKRHPKSKIVRNIIFSILLLFLIIALIRLVNYRGLTSILSSPKISIYAVTNEMANIISLKT